MLRKILLAITIMGTAAALWVALQRTGEETRNRTVEMTIEWTEAQQMAAVYHVPVIELLRQFARAGVTSVALQEETVRQLVDDGKVFRPDPFTDSKVRALIGASGRTETPRTVLAFPDPVLAQRVARQLAVRWGVDRVHSVQFGSMPALIVDGGYAQFRDLGVGLDPDAVALVKSVPLAIVGRVRNYDGLVASQIMWILNDLKASGAHAVVFYGDDVLGNPSLIKTTAGSLEKAGLGYGDVEFGKQHGANKLSRALYGGLIRVHTIQGSELANMTPAAAIDRFVKAVRERNMRLLYIHIMSSVTGASIDSDCEFLRSIRSGITYAGYQLGVAHPVVRWTGPLPASALAALGLAGALGLLVIELWGWIPPIAWAGILVCLAAVLAGLDRRIPLLEEGGAFIAALTFPTLSMIWAHPFLNTEQDVQHPAGETHARAARMALARLLLFSALSLVGALMIVAFLADTLYMTKTDQFVGIKPAIVLPILVIFAAYGGRWLDGGPVAVRWARLKERALVIMQEPLTVGIFLAVAVGAILLIVLVARSGNDSAIAATTFELRTRRILDGWLIARPRTKEFLLGNPALFLAFYAAARRWLKPVFILLVIGTIGQTSLVNTFCHIHTPLHISVFHAVNGLWLGSLIGWGASIVWDRSFRRSVQASP